MGGLIGVALQDIHVAVEYEDLFEPLRGLPPERGDTFIIEFESGTTLVSRVPYSLATSEMAKPNK